MSFADSYIKKHCLFNTLINNKPAKDLQMTVVIPCYNESGIENTIESLASCKPTKKETEVIIVINSSVDSPPEVLEQNDKTEVLLRKSLDKYTQHKLKFHLIHKKNLPAKHAGAGLARKIGMDEAVRRYNSINNPDGIIISFDADSLCKPNFLTSIEDYYSNNNKAIGSTVYFEHPITGTEFSPEIYSAITQYELYLRYYNQSLRYAGYPYAFHTIGSCFNVKVSAYTAQGGMNRKQAGEDFYFLQKIIPNGKFGEINTTCVYPSPRPSDRVPFGTGPMIKKLVSEKKTLQTYALQSFMDLKQLFSETDKFYKADKCTIDKLIDGHAEALKLFLIDIQFNDNINEINANSSTLSNFTKRFFKWFNAFKILKYQNFTQSNFYKDENIELVATQLLEEINVKTKQNISSNELLTVYRKIERTVQSPLPTYF